MRWDIDYAAAMGVLQRSVSEAEGYLDAAKGIEGSAADLMGVLSNSGLVAKALDCFAGDTIVPAVEDVTSTTVRAVQGTTDAVNAYSSGQNEMAANAQREATGIGAEVWTEPLQGWVSGHGVSGRG